MRVQILLAAKPAHRLEAPSSAFLFGTDEFGRDILSRILYGARISFQVGLIVVGIPGWIGIVFLTNAVLAISLVYIPPFIRVLRGATLTVRNTAYVEAAQSVGSSAPRLMGHHIFPNITAPLIVQASISFAFAILSEVALALLGLGNKAPDPSRETMVSGSYPYLQIAPWAAIVPGVAIAITVLGFNLLGGGLRDAMDSPTHTTEPNLSCVAKPIGRHRPSSTGILLV